MGDPAGWGAAMGAGSVNLGAATGAANAGAVIAAAKLNGAKGAA
jgi:hypothetical protein